MRKSRKEAAETRERIVATAAAEFRNHGIDSTGLAELMKAAGLTHGGFYKHFKSKDQLIHEAMAVAVADMARKFSADAKRGTSGEGLESAVTRYLAAGHCRNPADGCPLAALGTELARADQETRQIATDGFLTFVKTIENQMDDAPSEGTPRRALAVASLLVGALTMSRVVSDPELSKEILASGKAVVMEFAQ